MKPSGQHTIGAHRKARSRWVSVLISSIAIIVCCALGVWISVSPLAAPLRSHISATFASITSNSAQQDSDTTATPAYSNASVGAVSKHATPQARERYLGHSQDCQGHDCVSMLVNGDLLFHPGLWNQYVHNAQATDGTAFDFTELFAHLKPYIEQSDVSVCEFETPIAPRGGPYTGYPIFAIPPEVVDAVAQVGYSGCTHATNHSWDQGAQGIALLRQTLQDNHLEQVGSYTSQDQIRPMLLHAPNNGPTIGVVTGTVSLNGFTADQDWMVDRLREVGTSEHERDMQRIVAQARMARQEGADIVVFAMHSLQEYIDYADSWQIPTAHELAETGEFDLIYGCGSHSVQPIEQHNGVWIIYGTGNTVTEDAPVENIFNNQGMTARITFTGTLHTDQRWKVQSIDWVGSANRQGARNQWCSLGEDSPDGACWSAARDTEVRNRLQSVIYSLGADPQIVRPWIRTQG